MKQLKSIKKRSDFFRRRNADTNKYRQVFIPRGTSLSQYGITSQLDDRQIS